MTDFEQTDLAHAIGGEQPEAVEAQPEPQAEPEAAPVDDEPKAQEPEAKPQEEPKTEPEPTVPASVVGGLRAELRELKAQLAAQKAPEPEPDFYEDPQRAVQHQIAPVQQAVTGTKLEMSRFMAEREFGKETVEAAFEYFNQHPEQSQALLKHPSPFHAAVEVYNQQKVAQEIGQDPAAYRAKLEAELRAEIEAEMVAKQAKEAAARPAPSMADVTGTGGGPKTNWTGPTPLEDAVG